MSVRASGTQAVTYKMLTDAGFQDVWSQIHLGDPGYIWIGIAFLTNVSWGAGLLGIGVIVLAAEAARKSFGLALDWFWVLVGIVFALWGVCDAFRIQLGGHLWPILSIALGMAILLTGFRTHTREH